MAHIAAPLSFRAAPAPSMNIASFFATYQILASELERERAAHAETRRKAEVEREKLIDAFAHAVGKPSVFEKREVPTQSDVPALGIGPSAAQARREKQKREEEDAIAARAEKARNNGNSPDIPVIPH